MSAMEIQWEEPPRAHNTPRGPDKELSAFFDALRARPGEWARWPRSTGRHTAAAINAGRYRMAPRGEFEATCRAGVIYVRAVNR